MKTDLRIIISAAFAIAMLFSPSIKAQQVPEGYILVDSLVYRNAAAVDSTLAGKDIFSILPSRSKGAPSGVTVSQSADVGRSMSAHVRSNAGRNMSGYRVRIFFDNKQTARAESEAALKRFESLYHGIAAYRSYANPYFKVTVGDFRTKSEAMSHLERIKQDFPSAFVVKENISYPVVDQEKSYVVDTVRVLRPAVSGK